MEEMRQKVQNASTHILRRKNTSTHTTPGQCKGQSKGAMEEISRQGQKVSAPKMPDSSTRWCWSVLPCRRCRVLRPASQKTEHVTFHRGDGTLHMGSIRGKAHRLPDNAHSNGQHFSGAMEEMSGKVQNASTHTLRRQRHEHAHNSRSVQVPVQGG